MSMTASSVSTSRYPRALKQMESICSPRWMSVFDGGMCTDLKRIHNARRHPASNKERNLCFVTYWPSRIIFISMYIFLLGGDDIDCTERIINMYCVKQTNHFIFKSFSFNFYSLFLKYKNLLTVILCLFRRAFLFLYTRRFNAETIVPLRKYETRFSL